LLLVDETGQEAGYLLYNAYGGVLDEDLSPELREALAGQGSVADPTTGLVHLGGGRWYDPSMGRPLQPNPVGGPPMVPQALNRYAATGLGQPGVAEAAMSNAFNWTPHAIGFVKSLSVELAGQMSIQTGRYTAQAIIEVTASRTALKGKAFGRSFTASVFASAKDGRKFYRRLGFFTITSESRKGLQTSADEIIATLVEQLPSRQPWAARVALKELNFIGKPIFRRLGAVRWFKQFKFLAGPGLDFGISAYFQYLEDKGNPYLTPTQVRGRWITAGLGSAGFSVLGGAVGLLCGPGAVVCVPVGSVIGGLLWLPVQPKVFELISPYIDLEPQRKLAPLS
jgi:hypothetical protein